MRIHVGEADRHRGTPLYRAILELLQQHHVAGATVTQCIAGFGATRALHSSTSDVASLDLPVVVECVESEEKIQALLPFLDEMIGGGLITLERADVISYRAHGDPMPGAGAS